MISGYAIASARQDAGLDDGLIAFGETLLRRGDMLLQLEPADEALRRRHTVNRELVAQILAGAGRHGQAVAQQERVVGERELLARQQPGEPRLRRDLAFSRSVLGALNWTVEWFDLSKKDAVQKLARRTESIIFDGVKR